MAQNNETQVVNGVVQPRLYQVYGDLIESKEVMEPIAIANGTGPVCGFDWVDTTKNTLTIGSIFSSDREDMKGVQEEYFFLIKIIRLVRCSMPLLLPMGFFQ